MFDTNHAYACQIWKNMAMPHKNTRKHLKRNYVKTTAAQNKVLKYPLMRNFADLIKYRILIFLMQFICFSISVYTAELQH